ncbi:MAG TPA: PA0069 family radical SAM protein [Elusimicrobiota bacterium]|nr:PA0069 family radical SAM protein [Elusimicrobiota bacterium]
MEPRVPYRGRGAAVNPPNRFETVRLERDDDWDGPDDPAPATQFFQDKTRSLISRNSSPDIGFSASLNPYRGCEHGCAYCYARPTHEYLGFSAGLDFESKIMVKSDAPALLRTALSSPRWLPEVLAMSGVTDCYQPVERRLKITRGCLEVLAEFLQPVSIITKNALVTRDIDVLKELARFQAARVTLSVSSLRPELARTLEPRAAAPPSRLAAIEALAKAGIPVFVNVAPVIPGLNDFEMPAVIERAAAAGASGAGFTILRLPYAVAPIFEKWLGDHQPDAKEKVLHRIRELRGGRLNDSSFGKRMIGEGPYARHVSDLFQAACRRAQFPTVAPLSGAHFRRPVDDRQPEFGFADQI